MKKISLLILVFALALTLFSCDVGKPTKLGNSDFSITLPLGYAIAEDDLDEDQIAYFYKDDESIDFDVYQWEKGDEYTLESEANALAEFYGTVAEKVEINGINGMKYISVEEFDGETYTVVNYMFEDEIYIVEICFWTIDTEAEYADVDEIINTLKKN